MNVKIVDFTKYEVVEISCWQYDYGQLVQLIFPENFGSLQIQWHHEDDTIDPRVVFQDSGLFFAKIPNKGLEKPNSFVGYVYETKEDSGQTLYQIRVKVRARPSTDESVTEDELSILQQLILDTMDAKNQALLVPEQVWDSFNESEETRELIFQDNETRRNFWSSWDSGYYYQAGNKVEHEGSSYIALQESGGIEPGTNPGIWQLIAAKGNDATPAEKEDKNFVYQQIQPSFFWVIEHNFGKMPSVSVFEGSEINLTNEAVYGRVSHLDLNTITIQFSKPIYGFAILN